MSKKSIKAAIPNELLKNEREQRGWRLEDVADRVEVMDYGLVGKWERGVASPSHVYRQKLCTVFGKSAKELWLIKDSNPYWYLPHNKNELFTGRGDVLTNIHASLISGRAASSILPLAIRGLAGIGKTQTAIEYAYRYRDEYHTVLWASAQSRELLISDFTKIAGILKLIEKAETDQNIIIDTVKHWLERFTYWLLILDNVEDFAIVSPFLPSTKKGHILMTTRSQASLPIAKPIGLEKMEQQESVLFLLRRTGLIAQNASLLDAQENDLNKAREISIMMDGLPLAIDQVGAYIEEKKCSLSRYINLYRSQKGPLLKWRGKLTTEHLDSVYSTFLLSFKTVEQDNPTAADLLRVLAFLTPDDIPEEIVAKGASDLGLNLQIVVDPIQLDSAIAVLSSFSLVHRNADLKSLSIHRLVQEVLKDGMGEDIQRQWIERVVRAVNKAFPDVAFVTWPDCQRCLPQALICAELIERLNITLPEAARLLDQAGLYLTEFAQYKQAEPLLQRALAIREYVLGTENPSTATSLDNLGELYHAQGQYVRAEPLLQKALTIREKTLGPKHPSTADSLNNLARLYHDQRQYSKAEPLLKRALAIYEEALGTEHYSTAMIFNNLGEFYLERGQSIQAQSLLQKALTIQEKVLGEEHPHTASSLNNLAGLYLDQGQNTQAEILYRRALAIREKTLGPEHPSVATSLNNLASLYYRQNEYEKAESLLKQALAIHEKMLGPEHPSTATSLNNLGEFYLDQNQYSQAEPYFQRAFTIYERSLGSKHPKTFTVLENYQICYKMRDQRS
jgi:tetratricopeptide (TPR) repeat protein